VPLRTASSQTGILIVGDCTPGTQTTSGFATERSLAGSRVAYDPLTGKPVVIWSQGEANAGFQIVAGP